MNLDVHVPAWIIADGNYSPFHEGETRDFALEFYSPSPLTIVRGSVKSLRPQGGNRYRVSAEVVFVAGRVWVVDCGVLAYSEGDTVIPEGVVSGKFVEGSLVFGIDPFFYFEKLWKLPGMPPLVYQWHIDSVSDVPDFYPDYVLHCTRLDTPPSQGRRRQ